jgi:hypothetical protein
MRIGKSGRTNQIANDPRDAAELKFVDKPRHIDYGFGGSVGKAPSPKTSIV